MADVERTVGIRIEVTEAGKTQVANEHLEQMNKHLEAISANTKKVGKGVKEESDKMAAGFKSVEAQASALPGPIGNVATALGSVREGVGAFSGSLKTLRGALIATGIGAFAIVLASLYEYFTGSEKGAQKFRVAMGFLEGSFEAVVTLLEKIAINLINLFTEPQKTLKEFASGIKTYVIDNFNKILNGAGTLGKSLKLLFAGDFAGAMDAAKSGAKELGDGFLSLNPATAIAYNVAKGVKAMGEEAYTSAQAFAELAARMNDIEVAERELTVQRAQSNKTIATARLISNDVTRSTEERIAALKRAGALEEEVAAQEQKIAKDRLKVLEDGLQAGKEDEAQKKLIAEATVRVLELETASIGRRKELKSQELGLLREAEAAKKALKDAELARIKELEEANMAYMDMLFKRFQQGIEQDAADAAHMRQVTQETEDARIAIIEDAQLREEMTVIAAFERKMATITGQSEYEANLRKALTDKMNYDLTQIEKRYAAEQVKTAEQVRDAKLNAAQAAGNGLISVAKVVSAAMADNAEVSKAIATAEVWINAATATAAAISKAVQSSATPYDMIANIATAVATVAGAIASTVEILNKADIPGGGGGSVGAMPSFSSSAPQVPQVATNVTGLVNTQSAELQPIQAFVVETQMTGTQSNVAQIYSQATFGLGG